ncbi:MAG: 30S ribosomal protein S5 alanine N-acetyltransferase [Rhodobiaceae bacterium]|nr:MAG: 30S ribosomal protein S5 alanine N-acetyltransferase [Rhodobiaceae bacterium]
MAFLRSITRSEVAPLVIGQGVYLRGPTMGDYAEWAELRTRSRAFLTPWEPTWPADDLTRAAFRRRLRRYMRDVREDLAYPFLVFRDEDDALVGGVTVSNIHRGVQQSCTLGYWAGEVHSGNGYITSAVQALVPFIFDELHMHRIQAACLPENERSQVVLRKCGFTHEGIARGYLRIDGAWRDHVVFALLVGDRQR